MRLGRVSRYWIILLLAVILAKSAVSKDLYISPTGSDFNIGSIAEPFKSMTKARDVIRENNWNKTEAVTVFLREGTHYLSQPVKFSSEDSGNAKYPVTYTAYSGEKVIISGGMKLILKWEPYRDGIWQAQTPENVNIDQLFVNGQRQHMARYPNYDVNARPYNGAAADAFSPSRASRWEDPAGGYIHAMHRAHWGGYHYQITGKNENNEVTYKGGWQNNRQMGMHPNDRMVENIFEELDVPQEWFHDTKNHILYYYPPKEVDVKMACFEIAQLNHLIEFQGSQQRSVRYIILKGLTFSHASRTFMETKEPLLRSDWTIYRGGGVLFNGAEDCTLTDCEFNQLGGNSIFVNKYNRRIAIWSCPRILVHSL